MRALDPDVPVIVLTAFGTVETAVEAMKRGAFDYVLKPFDVEAIEVIIRKALEMRSTASRTATCASADGLPGLENLIGVSPAMQAIYDLVRRVAPTRSSVLITGETGTGKELVARAIHNLSPRAEKLFVPLNCAAIPSELLESELFGHTRGAFTGADRTAPASSSWPTAARSSSTRSATWPTPLQAKLLRVLQEGVIERIGSNKRVTVDVRVLSSTHRDLAAAMRDGRFREDLYYRLNVVHIDLPPLRERREDVVPLARHFLERLARELGRDALRHHARRGACARGSTTGRATCASSRT